MTHASRPPSAPLARFDGVLFFPVTPFDAQDRVNVDLLVDHVAHGVAQGAGGVFIACGTGEFHALSLEEYRTVVGAGVRASAGAAPVIAGVGGPIGQARAQLEIAEAEGADGLLLLPPYLVQGPADGIARYVEDLASRTALPVIVYHRGQSSLTLPLVERLCTLPNLAGFKDGVGDVALAQQFVTATRRLGRDDLQFFNGLLTAEASQLAYRAIGVPLYSSAAFAMAPDVANAFYRAYREDDLDLQRRLQDAFYTPLTVLRDSTPGYAISLIKAGLRLSGIPVGGVRPPLSDPSPEHLARLEEILAAGRDAVAARPAMVSA